MIWRKLLLHGEAELPQAVNAHSDGSMPVFAGNDHQTDKEQLVPMEKFCLALVQVQKLLSMLQLWRVVHHWIPYQVNSKPPDPQVAIFLFDCETWWQLIPICLTESRHLDKPWSTWWILNKLVMIGDFCKPSSGQLYSGLNKEITTCIVPPFLDMSHYPTRVAPFGWVREWRTVHRCHTDQSSPPLQRFVSMAVGVCTIAPPVGKYTA